MNNLVEKFIGNIDGNEMVYNETFNDYKKVWNSCTIQIVLLLLDFLIIIGIISTFFYFHWYLKKDNNIIKTSVNTETVIYQRYKWRILNKLLLKVAHITFYIT